MTMEEDPKDTTSGSFEGYGYITPENLADAASSHHDDHAALLIANKLSSISISETAGPETIQSATDDNPGAASLSPSYSDDDAGKSTLKPAGNRRSRNREKQRARRAVKRRQKHEIAGAAIESAAGTQDCVKGEEKSEGGQPGNRRHRPTQVERSMNFFMTICDWSRFFLQWYKTGLPFLNVGGGKLDLETAEAISRVVKRSWISAGDGDRSSGFKSLEELERFVELKEKEASYIDRQLKRMPSIQDEAWKSYFGELEAAFLQQQPVEEVLGGPAEFLHDTILPSLEAQVISLRARIREVRVLRDKYKRLCQKWDRQEELRCLISSLRISQRLLLPVCPVWKEVGLEIALLQGELLGQHDWEILEENRRKAGIAYEEALGCLLLVA
ncbi:hypothetical protein QBC37DRAFT_430787 [Rhypophila decipiens]|uniref:Uncharacterized protein n=1 Tax=Rhypophila decipiens TaxID=261697 RepID=A0AAN7B1E8_9PEZI|nr:hypothetical protein QBC37DRAFT_430787 [Rhypophila decipiens]